MSEDGLACCCQNCEETKRTKRAVSGKKVTEEEEEEEEEETESEEDGDETDEETEETSEDDDEEKKDGNGNEKSGEEEGKEDSKDDAALTGSGEECKANIKKKYPKAECGMAKSKRQCKKQCEKKGEDECKGSQGEIHKLNCKGEKPNEEGLITCCCAITCESEEKTKDRLNEEIKAEMGEDSSGICVNVTKETGSDPGDKLKVKLKELCSTQDRVFVARKFCLEEKKGKYFCVKDGKCLARYCIGCLKHECEIGGDKSIVNPPEDYMKKHLELKDFDKNVAVNVDDMKNVEKIGKWCSMIEDRTKCKGTCQMFGDRMCQGKALKYDHDDFCKRNAKQCKCCCEPVCKAGDQKNSKATEANEKENYTTPTSKKSAEAETGKGEKYSKDTKEKGSKDKIKKKVVEDENYTTEEESETEDTEEESDEETNEESDDQTDKKNKM